MSELKSYVVKRDGDRDIKFKGELIAEAWSSSDRASGNYSGSTGRSTELELYRTAKGKYVCSSIGRTQWQGEHDRYSAMVCDTVEDVQAFFEHGWLAKELYRSAGIDVAEEIE